MKKNNKTKSLAGGAGGKSAGQTASDSLTAKNNPVPNSFADWLAQPTGLVEENVLWYFPDDSSASQSGMQDFNRL